MPARALAVLREEWFLAVSLGASGLFFAVGPSLRDMATRPVEVGLLVFLLFLVILGSGLAVVRHADHLAIHLGEPYGTLILTFAVTVIEVISISSITAHGRPNPAMVRDTIFAAVMILLNGMVGISLLFGGWRHREQHYSLQGANAYLGVIIPLTVLILILPNYTTTTPGPFLSSTQEVFIALASLGLYAVFLIVQTIRHRAYFSIGREETPGDHEVPAGRSYRPGTHAMLLAAFLLPLVYWTCPGKVESPDV